MKISMLGYTNSGKTSYLGTMLSHLFNQRVEGFEVRAANGSEPVIHELLARIDHIYTRNKFPDATATTEEIGSTTVLDLSLLHNNNHIIDFSFIDYRGGILQNIAERSNDEETKIVAAELLMTDVLIVFVDAILLNRFKSNIVTARARLGVRQITAILEMTKQKLSTVGKELSVIIALTKTDASTLRDVSLCALKSSARNLFNNFGGTGNSPDWKVVELGILGQGNVNTTITNTIIEDGSQALRVTNQPTGDAHLPVNIVSLLAESALIASRSAFIDFAKLSDLIAEQDKKLNNGLKVLIDRLFYKSKGAINLATLKQRLEESYYANVNLKKYNDEFNKVISLKK
ncbi:MAG: hypothetical protein FWB72_04640 [Firmicutes bacterium]|nr:hypothetical protein [Bacillota bacterium]